ncbi:MoaD/ThiS family protein [Synechococcus sp. PCC 7336]|uniref:MoaD/ThiS family protein n=1 Tax=Synechococcus sp. PCC 7336 TaxID=195250 RepID=UPI000365E8BD|nr:MoaD/ThiS family protein [Synechococcus sp. PCC 7336]
MPVKVLIPTPLRAYTSNQDSVELEGSNIGEILDNLTETYSDLKRHLYNEEGQLRNFVNVYLGDEDIRHLEQGKDTPVTGDETISIVPSIAGGC